MSNLRFAFQTRQIISKKLIILQPPLDQKPVFKPVSLVILPVTQSGFQFFIAPGASLVRSCSSDHA
jgi:hypothetical protein